MKKIISLLFAGLVGFSIFAAPTVTDVVAKQRYPWNGLVDITCKVSGLNELEYKFNVEAIFPDSSETQKVQTIWLVRNGTKSDNLVVNADEIYHLLWDANADFGEVRYTNMVVRVSFVDKEKVQLWEGGPYWATTNIGANEPWESGYYFWWGDTIGYKWEHEKFVASDGSSSTCSFYNVPTAGKNRYELEKGGWITSEGILSQEHDAAHIQLRGGWRTPLLSELADLVGKCTWKWTSENGVEGYIVQGKGSYDSSSIFLPAAREAYYGHLDSLNWGYYWSSTLYSSYNTGALYMRFDSGTREVKTENGKALSYGMPIRPVSDASLGSEGSAIISGESAPISLDTANLFVTAPIAYNASWIGNDSDAIVVITDNGAEIYRGSGVGDFAWAPQSQGKHTLTYTTFINGVAQDEVYEAIVYADWKYTVEDGKATIVETTQKSGSVTIPSEIDGFPVVGLGDGLFDGCEGLTSVTIPDSVASVGKGAFDGCTGIRSVSLSPTFKIRSFSSGLIQAKFNSSDDFTSSIIDSESKSLVSGVLMGDAYDTESVTRTYTDPKYGGSYKWNSRYTTFGYAGYMYMVEGRTYVFGKYFDDSVLVRINGNEVLKNTDHTAFATGKYIPEKTGWHEIEVRVADGTGEKGPKGVQNGDYWSGNLGVAWRDDGITDALPESGWNRMMDPGGGSLFRCFLEEVQDLTMRGLFPDSYDKLTNATLIGDAAVIPNNAFAGCAALESFTIPDSVYSIGANAFANCTGLTNVSMPFPLKVQVESGNVFDGCSENLEIVYRTAQIKNVVAKQRFPWNGKVDVSFDIEGNALAGFSPNNLLSLVVTAEDRKIGEKYIASNASLSGDIDLTTGTHKIVWDLKSNGYEFKSDDIVISVACKSTIEGLISQYLFNDDLCDSSNNNYDLSGQEGCFVADRKGVDNGAYSFNGAKQSITSTDCRLETEFTFAFWFKTSVSMSARGTGVDTSGYSGWYGNYVLFPRNCGSDAGFGVKIGTDGISVIAHGDGYLSEQLGYSANIGTGWNHIAVSVSSDGSIGIYLNGVCVKTGTKSSSRKSVFVPEVGGGPYGYYTGCIDELLVFDKELDADTIALIYSDCVIANDWDAIYEGESSSILVDTYPEPLFEMGVDKISYNSSWIGGESSAEVVISDNGTEIKRTTGEGEFAWSPTTVGKHTLTYTTYIDGIQQEEVYTATVFKDWKYTVSDGKATIVETTQKSGSVTIPSEIDGLPVIGIRDELFNGFDNIVDVTMPCTLSERISDIFPDSFASITNVVLTGNIMQIPTELFVECASLKSITLQESGATLYLGNDNGWRFDEDGILRSGKITHKESSFMSMSVQGEGRLTYRWKASTDHYDEYVFDYAYLSIGDVAKGSLNDYMLSGIAIGGNTEWNEESYDIVQSETDKLITWTFRKDESDDGEIGEDCVWVDSIAFTPFVNVAFDIADGEGEAPNTIKDISGGTVTLPTAESFQKPKHTLIGWSDGSTTYTPGAEFVLGTTDVVLRAVYESNTISTPIIASDDVVNGGEIITASATISITADDGVSIYYTLDGSTPTMESIVA